MNRRNFLRAAAAAGVVGPALHSWAQSAAANPPLRVGLIGCGWYGKSDLCRLLQVAPVEVVALCDVDNQMLAEASALVAQRQASRQTPRTYRDYRAMLEAGTLDLVLVATPDHWHALAAMAALQAGAHLYLQKPVSVDVLEGEAILAEARRLGRTVQVGTQRRSTPHLIEARETIVRAGLLGKVAHAGIHSYYPMRQRGNPPEIAPPAHLDWEMWTGPAPLRPYHEGIHPGSWRSYREYGNGIIGDMGVHMLDAVRWMLDLGWPKRVSSSGGLFVDKASRANIPDTQTATFEFDDLTVVWEHRTWGAPPDPRYPWGLVLHGDKGTLKAGVERYEFIPVGGTEPARSATFLDEADQFPADKTEKRIEIHAAPATRRHFRNLLACIADGSKPVADIEQGHISSASCILANLALGLGRPLSYDPATRSVPGDAEATAALRRPYRAPWRHPAG